MPGIPRVADGLIRTYEFLEALSDDVLCAYAILELDRSSQFKRRCVARAVFSYLEAVVECIKVEIRSTVRRDNIAASLTEKDEETLETLSLVGSRHTKYLPLDQNLKRTFKLAAKVWRLTYRLSSGSEAFRSFLASKRARNFLTHPRKFYDIEVTDLDMHNYSTTYVWFQREFVGLFRAWMDSLMEGLPAEDVAAPKQAITKRDGGGVPLSSRGLRPGKLGADFHFKQ